MELSSPTFPGKVQAHMLILLPPSDLAKGLAYEKFLINIHSVVEK